VQASAPLLDVIVAPVAAVPLDQRCCPDWGRRKWANGSVRDLVTVEVKLAFTAHAVQQALNYTRFSHRVWVAVPVQSNKTPDLPLSFPVFFEYAVSNGLGILACWRRRGRSYDVFPVQWPRRNEVDPLEEERFHERYRAEFEKAGVIPRSSPPPRRR